MAKDISENLDFPILRLVDSYILEGGRIEKRHSKICLVDKDGEYLAGGKTTKELLENCIWTFC